MAKNLLLHSIRDALGIDDATMVQIFRLAGREVGLSTIAAFLKTEEDDGYIPCSDPILGFFLDGLIIQKRGPREDNQSSIGKPVPVLSNNAILKKLRIALDLKEEDMVAVFASAGNILTKHELTALFRKQGHKHYKECSDRLLKNFITGLALRPKE